MFKHVIVSVGRKVSGHLHWQTLKIILKDHALLFINLVSFAIAHNRLLNKLHHFLALNPINYFIDSWICESLRISLLSFKSLLQRCILDKNCLGFESVNELLSKLYALFAVVFAAKHNYHLFSLLVLHDDDPVFEIEIHHDVFWRLQVECEHCLL